MRTRIGILLLVMVLGVSGNVWLDEWTEHVGREASPEILEQNMGSGASDQPEKLSWWTLLYERPNPDRLPVKVNLWFAKNT
ncbi:MAG: hypothetical protein PUD21_04075 [Clostridiaceae bacterium]|nr:hypothetical protein [Clostridiaceae bacterium]